MSRRCMRRMYNMYKWIYSKRMDAVNGTTSNSRDSARDFAHREPLSLTWTKSGTLIVVFRCRNCRNSHCKVAPYFQLVSQQKPRQDLQYIVPPEPTTDSEESGSDTDIEMESWIKFLSVKDGRVPNQQDLLETPNNLARKSMFTHYIFDSWTLTMVKNLVMVKDLCSHTPHVSEPFGSWLQGVEWKPAQQDAYHDQSIGSHYFSHQIQVCASNLTLHKELPTFTHLHCFHFSRVGIPHGPKPRNHRPGTFRMLMLCKPSCVFWRPWTMRHHVMDSEDQSWISCAICFL